MPAHAMCATLGAPAKSHFPRLANTRRLAIGVLIGPDNSSSVLLTALHRSGSALAYRIYLAIAGTVFLVSGIFTFFDPHAMGVALGIAPIDGSGVTEIRATYGGLVVGSGLLAIWGVFSERLAAAALACILFCGGGLVFTRIVMELFSASRAYP